jgi:aspartate kinase
MLMAHGFLKRIFDVFERYRTSVDVVTTSEVSVSVTIDDRRHLPAIIDTLEEVAEVTREDDMAIICAVGEGLQNDPTFVSELLHAIGDVPIRMVSQAASRRNITFVIRAADLSTTLARVHARFFAHDEGSGDAVAADAKVGDAAGRGAAGL